MNDPIVFGRCKPLRNRIRNLDLTDSLAVIHAYIAHLQFGNPIPSAIEVHRDFQSAEHKVDKAAWLSEWELEVLCREIIIHADSATHPTSSLAQWKVLSKISNELRDLKNSSLRGFLVLRQ